MSLSLPLECVEILQQADGKALATQHAEGGVHVVPVSVLFVHPDHITLVNFFMGQTVENILADPAVSLAVWQGLRGYQIKGQAEHYTNGDIFSAVTAEIAATMQDRTVQGIVTITPQAVFDISADPERAGKLVWEA